MKKSKFLQNSKDMLSRSFNPAKCKTSLRLAGSRIKLFRNKKEVQVKQMKKEIAQLLESGQDQTARIRVEHVIREEKMMAAYDLLEIYCELIVARLPIIESQKNCPIDLKEAIASVIFASPRCGDVPELLDIRKHFTAKYGKDFTTAAIELRPQCGVGRLLVEKLSAVAPDGQTKVKILSAIAEEYNVRWDPKSFEEKDPVAPSDLLSGPSTFGKEGKHFVEPPHFEAADVQARPGNNKMHSSALNFPQPDPRISVGAEKLTFAQSSGVSTACQPEARPPGGERAQLFQGDSTTSSVDRQRWNMEFKDATSAAQAAAESAERASMAARAAAELSSQGKIMRQFSTESHKSDAYFLKDEGLEKHPKSKVLPEQFSEESVNRSSSKHTSLQNEQINGIKPDDSKTAIRSKEGRGGSEEYSRLASLKSKTSIDDDFVDHRATVVDHYSQKNSFEEVSRDEMSTEKQSFKHEAETANRGPEKAENFQEERTRKQHSVSSSRSHSSVSDDVNIFANSEELKFESDAGKNSFVGIGEGGIHGVAPSTSSHEYAAVVFDKFDSDSDDHGFDTGLTYDEQKLEFDLPTLDQKLPEHPSKNIDSWSPRSNSFKVVNSTSPLFFTRETSPDFSENLTSGDGPQLDTSAPVRFDDSDEPTSESDEDMNHRHNVVEDSRDLLYKHNESGPSVRSWFEDESGQSVESQFKNKGNSGFDRKQLSLSSDEELKAEEMLWGRNKVNKFDAESPKKLSLQKPSAEESQMEFNDLGNKSSPETEERLNFGNLTGGLRHKGYTDLPPFLKNRLDVSSSVEKETDTTTTATATATATRSTNPPAVEFPKTSNKVDHRKNTGTPDLHSESDSDSSEVEESLQKSSGHKEEMYTVTAAKEVKTKLRSGASDTTFVSDNRDSDEDPPKESLSRKSHPRSGMSRRTKASPSSSTTNSYFKMHPSSDTLDSDAGIDRKPTTSCVSETRKQSESQRNNKGETQKPSNSYSDTQQELQSSRRTSNQLGNPEQPSPAKIGSKPTNSNIWRTPEKPNSGKATSMAVQDANVSLKSSAVEEEASISSGSSNEVDSTKKPSHVHPKLPDYDTLIQSLRKNRS